jgi:hypothetical protein
MDFQAKLSDLSVGVKTRYFRQNQKEVFEQKFHKNQSGCLLIKSYSSLTV